MSTKKRSELAKKAWRKRKKGGLSEHKTASRRAPSRKTPARKKYRKVSRRRNTLSEMVTNIQAQAGVNTVFQGAVGGVASALLDKALPATMPKNKKMLWNFLAAFGMATIGNAPYAAAGMGAVSAYQLMGEVGLSENQYADDIEKLPMVLDSSGQPMQLSQSPETGGLYLEQNDDGMYLQEADYQVPYAPDFGANWDRQYPHW